MKKTLSALLAALISAALLVSPALALLEASDQFYVNDSAGVLSDSTKDMIVNYNGELEYYCDGAQIVVVTIDYLPTGYDSEQYANLLFNTWGVGSASANNGMLLLTVTQEYRCWLALGAGIDDVFTQADADYYFENYFYDKLDAEEYDEAVSGMFPQLLKWYEGHYGQSFYSGASSGGEGGGVIYTQQPSEEYYGYDYGYGGTRLFSTLFKVVGFIILVVIIMALLGGNSVGRQSYYRSTGLWPWLFLFGMTSRRNRRPPSGPWYDYNDRGHGGGFGGGFHGGSGFGGGGRSGGGGFGGGGGFHGGGGFGGGGHSGGGGGGRR